MKEISIEEQKAIQLDMLKDIHSFCVSSNIRYSLAFGSLLGAVRHRGYIPWDDDIDIMMSRDNYNRFVRSYGNSTYKIADMSVNPDYGLPFAKVEDSRTIMEEYVEGVASYGIYIDIFPVDCIPDKLYERKFYYWMKDFWNILYNLKTTRVANARSIFKNFILVIGHILLSFFSKRFLARRMSGMASKYAGMNTSYVGIVAPADSRIEEAIPSIYFEEYVELPFENINVMSIKEFDKYLNAAYGDYMQLPPIEQRISHHEYVAYWK